MSNLQDSVLFTPYRLGQVTLRNRTIRSAAFESMGKDFSPTQQLKDYHVSVARGGIGNVFYACANVTHFSGGKLRRLAHFGIEISNLYGIELLTRIHQFYSRTSFNFSVENSYKTNCALIIIVKRIKNKRFQRFVFIPLRRGKTIYDLFQNLVYPDSLFCADLRRGMSVYSYDVLYFRDYFVGTRGRKVDFVYNG